MLLYCWQLQLLQTCCSSSSVSWEELDAIVISRGSFEQPVNEANHNVPEYLKYKTCQIHVGCVCGLKHLDVFNNFYRYTAADILSDLA